MVFARFSFRFAVLMLALTFVAPELSAGQAFAQQSQQTAPQQSPAGTTPAPSSKQAPAAAGGANAPASQQTAPATETPAAPAEPAPPPAPVLSAAEQQSLEELRQPIMELRGLLETLEGSVEQNKGNDSELARLRAELVDLVQKAQSRLAALKEKTTSLRQQLEKLKPTPPAEGESAAPESEQVAAERTRLGVMLSEVDGAQKTGELVQVRARQLQTDVQKLRQDIFTQELLYRSSSPLKPETWTKLRFDLPGAWRQLVDAGSSWVTAATEQWFSVSILLAGGLLLYIVLKMLVRRFVSYQLDAPRVEFPGFVEQAATVGWVAPVLALPALASIGIVAAGLDALGMLSLDVGPIAQQAFLALAVFAVVRALTHAVLQPRRPEWRLISVETTIARRLTRIVTGIAFVFALDSILQEIIRRLYLPLSINALETIVTSALIGLLLLKFINTPFDVRSWHGTTSEGAPGEGSATPGGPTAADPPPEPVSGSLLRPFLIKIPALAAAIAILLTSALGYVGLARLITTHVVITGGAIAMVLVAHLAIR